MSYTTIETLKRGGAKEVLQSVEYLREQTDRFILIGGANLVLRGVKPDTTDIDVLSPYDELEALSKLPLATVKQPPYPAIGRGATNFSIWIENQFTPLPISATDRLGDGHYPMSYDGMIDRAEDFDGVPMLPLQAVFDSKRLLARPKDLADIPLIERHLGLEPF